MFKLKMKLSGTMRGIPAPTQEINRCFSNSATMLEYLAVLLDSPHSDITVEHMEITQE